MFSAAACNVCSSATSRSMVALVCSSAASRSMVLLSSELIAFFSHRPEPVQRLEGLAELRPPNTHVSQ
jgi:hypothetical protein